MEKNVSTCFNTQKAYDLAASYKKEIHTMFSSYYQELLRIRYFKKILRKRIKLIHELTKMQSYFGEKSIVGCPLLLNGIYPRHIVSQVLRDLNENYSICYFKRITDVKFLGIPIVQHTIICFDED